MNSVAGKQLALLLTVALALRLTAGWTLQTRLEDRFALPDSEGYWALGEAIAEGGPYQCGTHHWQVFRAPGYPLLLAPIFWMAGGDTAVMLARAQAALLGTLAVAGVWGLARQLFDARTGLIAAAIATVYPGAIAMSVVILSEAPFCALLPMHLLLWTKAWQAESPRRAGAWAFGGGLVAGVATLMRPSWLLFTPVAILVGVVVSGRRLRHAGIGLAMIAGLAVAMLPWWIRNARVTGHFVPTTLQVGASLYDGLNPEATGASNMDFVPRFVQEEEQAQVADDQPGESLEIRLDRRLRSEALAWARDNPGKAAQLAAVKLFRVWNIWPNEPRLSSWPIRLAVLVTYVPVLALGIIGAAKTVRRGWPYVLCWLPAVYLTALHMIFVSSIRYREPAMLGLIVLAAGVLGRMKDKG